MPQPPSPPEHDKTQATDERRRAALRRLGRGAAVALPATLAVMTMGRAAAAS